MAAQEEPEASKDSSLEGGEVSAMLPWGEVRVREGFAIVMGPTLSAPGGPSRCQILIYGNESVYQVLSQELTSSHVSRAARAFLPSAERREAVGKEEGPSPPATPVQCNAVSFAHNLGLRRRIPSSPLRQSRRNITGVRSPLRLRPLDWLRHEAPLPLSELERLREQRELQCRYQHGVRSYKFPIAHSSSLSRYKFPIAHKSSPSRYKFPIAHTSSPSRYKFPIASIRSVGNETVSKCKTNLLDGNEARGDKSTDAPTSRRTDVPPAPPARPLTRLSASAARAAAATADWSHSYTAPRRRSRHGLNFRSRALLKRCCPCTVRVVGLRITSLSGGCSAPTSDELQRGCNRDSDGSGCCIDANQQPEQSTSTIAANSSGERGAVVATPIEDGGVRAAGGDAGLSGHLLRLLARCKPCVVALARVAVPSPRRRTRATRAPHTRSACICSL